VNRSVRLTARDVAAGSARPAFATNGTVLPEKPDRRLARAFFGSGGEVCEERTREELFEVDGAWPVVNELHHRREIVGPKSRPAAEHSSGERRTQGSITKVGTGTSRSLATFAAR
jgi:hypothetical protein